LPLDPDLQRMLALLESLDPPAIHEGTPEAARAGFRVLTVDLRDPASVVEVGEVDDLEVDGGAGPLPARRYRPQGVEGPLPTIVHFHGGGFVLGDLDTHDNQRRRLCRDVGAVVLGVGYRVAPDQPFPAAYDDAVAATRWAAAHLDELGDDPDRLVVAGDSAGGNLAAGVAQLLRDAGGPRLAAQLLIYPSTDHVDDGGTVHPSRLDLAEGYFLTAEDMRWFGEHYAGTFADRRDPRLSPLNGDLRDLPPAVVVTAEFDPLRDEGDAYARAMTAAGVPVRHRRFDGLIHGFFDLGALSPACDEAIDWTCAALREVLDHRA
jgi:acetyl esterase